MRWDLGVFRINTTPKMLKQGRPSMSRPRHQPGPLHKIGDGKEYRAEDQEIDQQGGETAEEGGMNHMNK